MSIDTIGSASRLLKASVAASAIAMIACAAVAQHAQSGPFAQMSGHWSGGGVITSSDGTQERIRCSATYSVSGGGDALSQSLRCASASYSLNISSNVHASGGSISGSWSESSHSVSGSVSGRSSGGSIQAHVAGGTFSASLSVQTRGNRQSVSIRPQGVDVTNVAITMHKA
jgi:hypothetical protein